MNVPQETINAACCILGHIIKTAEGIPDCSEEVLSLIEAHGVLPVPWRDMSKRTSKLVYVDYEWFIFYNPGLPEQKLLPQLIHEFAEYLLADPDYAYLFDGVSRCQSYHQIATFTSSAYIKILEYESAQNL